MGNCSISHEEATIASFRNNKTLAITYLNQVLADGDQEECMLALRRVVEAYGSVADMARQSALNEKSLHRTLSAKGNPTLKSLLSLSQVLGLRLSFQPVEHSL